MRKRNPRRGEVPVAAVFAQSPVLLDFNEVFGLVGFQAKPNAKVALSERTVTVRVVWKRTCGSGNNDTIAITTSGKRR